MQILADIINVRSPLQVVCAHCSHGARVSPRLLKDRLSLYTPVADIPFCCSACGSRDVKLGRDAERIDRSLRRHGPMRDLFESNS